MCKFICQAIKSNFHDFFARTLSHAISESTQRQAHNDRALAPLSTEKWRKMGLINYNNRKMSIYLMVIS